MTPEAALAAAIEQVEVYGDVPAADLLAALHDAGWVLTPLAPEVPPRGTLTRKEIRRLLLTLGAGEGRTDDFYTGWGDCWVQVLDVLDVRRKPR